MKRVELGLGLLFLLVAVLLVNTSVAKPAVNQTNEVVLTNRGMDTQANGAVVANYYLMANAPTGHEYTNLENDHSCLMQTANVPPAPEVAYAYIGNCYLVGLSPVMDPLSALCDHNVRALSTTAPEVAYCVILEIMRVDYVANDNSLTLNVASSIPANWTNIPEVVVICEIGAAVFSDDARHLLLV